MGEARCDTTTTIMFITPPSLLQQVDQRSTSHARDLRGCWGRRGAAAAGVGASAGAGTGAGAGLHTPSLKSAAAAVDKTESLWAVIAGASPPSYLKSAGVCVGDDEAEEGEECVGW